MNDLNKHQKTNPTPEQIMQAIRNETIKVNIHQKIFNILQAIKKPTANGLSDTNKKIVSGDNYVTRN